MSETKKYIYCDGSIASKLLQYELKNATVIKVSGNNLVENFTKFNPKNNGRIYLPFTSEQLVANNEQLRKDIQKVESLGFKNQIVLPYEGDTTKTVEQRAKEAGIGKEVLRGVNNEKKESSNTNRRNDKVQYLP